MNNQTFNKISNTILPKEMKSLKIFLWLGIILSIIIDSWALAFIIQDGYSSIYYIYPIVLIVFDVLFLIYSLFANQRFKYSLFTLIFYFLFIIVSSLALLVFYITYQEKVIVTLIAMIIWTAIHLFIGINTLITYIFASSRIKKKQIIISTLFLIFMGLFTGGFGYYTQQNGVFGQGRVEVAKTLEYSYNNDLNGYEVVNTMSSKGNTIIVPEKFNNISVVAVDSTIFTDKTVKYVRFEKTNNEITFINSDIDNGQINNDISIYAEEENYIQIKKAFDDLTIDNDAFLQINNNFYPEIADDEVMVSFSYDEQSFNDANQSLLGVWIGKKGATFNIENATIVPEYAKHIVHTNKNDLTWNYNNNNKKILSNLDLNKKSITKNYIGKDSIQIKFDDIYSIKINSDNDEKYELSDNDRFTNKTLNLKLATEENINNLFNVSQRDGFDLEWFSNSNYDVASKINNYTDFVLKSKYDIDVYPKWTLHTPKINNITTNLSADNEVIYGNQLILKSQIPDKIATGINYRYTWMHNNNQYSPTNVNDTVNYQINNVVLEDAGNYILQIEAYSNNITSLVSSSSTQINIQVAKRKLDFSWSIPSELIYNGENQFDKIKCTYNTNDVVHNDQITFSYTSQTFINHGDYTLNIYLTGDTYNKYYIASGKEKTNFEIKQRAISLIWDSNTTFTYDGDFKDVKVINITGHVLSERDAILSSIIYSGKQIDAGHHEMTATVPSDSNYVVTANNSCNFEISKRDLLITFKPTTKTYDGIIPQSFDYNVQENDIAPTDTLNNILTLRYTGDAVKNVDVGVYDYGAGYVANSLAKNYNITIIDNKLTIIQRDLNITFNEKNKTYDGKALDKKDFTYRIDSLASKDSLEQVITLNINDECLQAIDANTYTIDATYEAKELAKNYNISIVSNKLNITKRNLNITFNSQNKTYDGKIFDNEFTYNINSLASTDSLENVLTLTLTGTALTAIDSGKYEINATYEENELAKNYNITVIRNELTINKRNLTITLDSQEKVYDGKVFDGEFTYNYDNLADTDNLNEVLSLDFSKAKEIINSGEHLINPECNGNSKYDNYNVNIVDNYLTINLRTLTINLNNQEKIYDGKLFTEDNEFDYEVVNLASTDRLEEVLELTIQGNAITAINQGSYEIDAQYVPKNKSNNYDITINGATYTIKKRQITAKWDDTNLFIYNGTIPSYKIATLNGVVAGEESNTLNSIQYNISDGNDGKYVGEHIVIASLRADSNYEFENSQVQTQSTYYVTKCELQITFEMQNKTYDGQMMKENEFTYEVNGLARTDQLNQVLTLTVTGSALTAINKGQYSINATYRENTLAKNYNIKIIGNTLTINPKEINLVWSLPESNYIYNGENQYPTVTRIVNAVVGEEEDIKSALVYQNYGKDAGEYDVSVTLNNNNYVIISNNDTCHYTIVKRDLTITFRDQEKVYDGNKFDEEEFTYDVVGLASTDQLDEILTLTLSGTAIDATSEGNDYIINATYELTSKGEKNYNVTIVAGKLVIKSSDEDSDEPVESEMLDEIKLSDLLVNKDVIKLWE